MKGSVCESSGRSNAYPGTIGERHYEKTIRECPALKTTSIDLQWRRIGGGGWHDGCAGDRYTQSTGERTDDNRTAERVRETLGADTQYNRAGDLAKKVAGVKALENNIIVKESGD